MGDPHKGSLNLSQSQSLSLSTHVGEVNLAHEFQHLVPLLRGKGKQDNYNRVSSKKDTNFARTPHPTDRSQAIEVDRRLAA